MRLVSFLVLISLVGGCSRADPAAVEAARLALRGPAVALGEAVVRTQRTMDKIRHKVPRGQAMKDALAAVPGELATLRSSADQLDALAGKLDARHPVVGKAVQAVRDLTGLARTTAAGAESEANVYGRLAGLDVAMDGIVAGWDEGGTQRERRLALSASAKQAAALAARAAALPPMPGVCPALRDNRARWGRLVAERSAKLAGVATSTGGAVYDEFRDRYRPQPYGVADRIAADAADRACWETHSAVATAETEARTVIARLADLLNAS
ncbi:MAG: hypothetical protein ACRDZ4_12450 [Egibacteraceae bacterium]